VLVHPPEKAAGGQVARRGRLRPERPQDEVGRSGRCSRHPSLPGGVN
jgi:hypothetical protein